MSVRAMARELGVRQQTLDRVLKSERGMGGKTFEAVMAARPEWWGLLNGSAPAGDNGREPGGAVSSTE